jgi:hypothetical protein
LLLLKYPPIPTQIEEYAGRGIAETDGTTQLAPTIVYGPEAVATHPLQFEE